jgi:hypothetical protein
MEVLLQMQKLWELQALKPIGVDVKVSRSHYWLATP